MGSKLAFSSVPSKPSYLDAELRGLALEILGDALAVGRLVVKDVGALHSLGRGELGADRALDVVAAADAVDFGVAAISDLRVGVGGRDVDEAGGVVLLRGRDLDAGVVVADDREHAGIGHDILGVGDAGVWVALVVEGGELDLEAELDEGTRELLDGELGAVLDVGADRRHASRQGALSGDLDNLGLRAAARSQEHAERRDDGQDEKTSLFHLHYLRFFLLRIIATKPRPMSGTGAPGNTPLRSMGMGASLKAGSDNRQDG